MPLHFHFRIRHKLTTALVALFLLAFGVAVFVQKTDYRFGASSRFRQIEKGMPESEVLRRLGPPDRVQTIPNQYDLSYKVQGYTFRAFTRGGTVYVYQTPKDVCYVLLDGSRVVDISIGFK